MQRTPKCTAIASKIISNRIYFIFSLTTWVPEFRIMPGLVLLNLLPALCSLVLMLDVEDFVLELLLPLHRLLRRQLQLLHVIT